ncbi:MAG: hypothetical protein QW186_02310 [Candidatus Bathyarchaeia archaeon]
MPAMNTKIISAIDFHVKCRSVNTGDLDLYIYTYTFQRVIIANDKSET